MAIAEPQTHHHEDHHDHGEFIAHHFDSAEQQFDSGKLGIWLFLVTEVLFFSGLFVAYTLYRNHHPEIFQQAHVYLDKVLGGINTVVLLFSSLTMALAVRAAQLGRNRQCAIYVLVTMVCAAMFLGVKAVEYSHKWEKGIWVRKHFSLDYNHHITPETALGQAFNVSDYLIYLSIIPAILLGVFVLWAIVAQVTQRFNCAKLMAALAIMVLGYFIGAVGGEAYEKALHGDDHDHSHAANQLNEQPLALHAFTLAGDDGEDPTLSETAKEKLHRDIGIFFSIYYCMTGLHAIHIIAGIIALAWVLWRSILGHWRSDYFGPVDFVGLYWHLVDLIWIYLFPLLYLID
jgi:cytochrome c oxidase subunit 3